MFDERSKTAPIGLGLCCLVFPLLLTQCGDSNDHSGAAGAGGAGGAEYAGNAGAANVAGQSGSVDALGGATNIGGASAGNAGSAAGSTNAGLGGDTGLGNSGAGAAAGAAGEAAGAAGAAGNGGCSVELTSYSSPSAAHVALCSAISYPMNPPVYGNHYPVWAAYKSYSFPVPLGFLVHNLEHGAIVLLYNCPEGCAEEVASAQTLIDSLPADPRCIEVAHQVVMSPDPSLPTRWGAVAWGQSLASDCFAPAAFRAFYTANLAHGSEDLCGNGADLSADTCQ